MLNRFAFMALAAGFSSTAFAQDNYSDTWFPLWEGNEWVFHSGLHEVRVATDYQDGNNYYLTGFLGADQWAYQNAWNTTYATRILSWNPNSASWSDLLRFEKANNVTWNVNLTNGACDTYKAQRKATGVSSSTPVGSFTSARRYQFDLVPEANVRCATPLMQSVVFAPGVGPVEFKSAAGTVYKLVSADVDGWSYGLVAPKQTLSSNGVQATLSLSSSRYNNQPNTIACITQPCPSNQVNGVANITFTVKNTGSTSKTFNFESGHQTEFVVVDSTGTTIAKWGSNQVFTQSATSVTLAAGQSKTWTATLEMLDNQGQQLAGYYTLQGWMIGSSIKPTVPLFVAQVLPQ